MRRNWRHRADFLALTTLLVVVIIFHHSALFGSWRWDDGMHLLHATQYAWSSVFIDPDVLRSVSGNQFAPWNLFLYYINGALFGADAHFYYAHHLLSLFAGTAGVYALLRQWLPARHAWMAPALLLTGVPTFQMAQQLMVGHYLYGLLFATAGLIFLIRAVHARVASPGIALALSLISAMLYGLACLCKEIYVPWILMWLVIPTVLKSSLKRTIIHVLPAMLVALAYTIVRLRLFGGAEGYYGGGARSWEALSVIQSLLSIPGAMLGEGIRGLASLALILLALIAGSRRSFAWVLTSASALLITLVPLAFLASSNPPWDIHARYLWAPWLLTCLVWAAPWHGALLRFRAIAYLLFAGMVGWQVVSVRPDDQQREAMFDAHSRMVLQQPSKATYWAPADFNGSGYMTFVSYAAYEALRRNGDAPGDPPKILRTIPSDPAQQAAVQVWHTPCNCFRALLSLTPEEREATLARMQADRGMLLPGSHPLADMYGEQAPEMHIEGNRLHVAGTAVSQGPGHVLLLSGWAPSKLVASRVTTHHADASEFGTMRYTLLLEAANPEAAERTRQQLCVLMQSQSQPYSFIALDSAAPSTACRKLLTPWALRNQRTSGHP